MTLETKVAVDEASGLLVEQLLSAAMSTPGLAIFHPGDFGFSRRVEEDAWKRHSPAVVESQYAFCVKQKYYPIEVDGNRELPRQTVITVVQGRIGGNNGQAPVPFLRVTYRHASQDYKHHYFQVAFEVMPDASFKAAPLAQPTCKSLVPEQQSLLDIVSGSKNAVDAFERLLSQLSAEKRFNVNLGWEFANNLIPKCAFGCGYVSHAV